MGVAKKKDECSVKTLRHFSILNAVFVIVVIMGCALLGITLLNMYSVNEHPSTEFVFSDLAPPFTGIIGGIFICAGIIGIYCGRALKKEFCDNGVEFAFI